MIKKGKVGSGTYGIVYRAETTNNRYKLAVKRNIVEKTTNFSGSLRELDILNKLRGHPYIVDLCYVSFGNPFSKPNSPLRGSDRRLKDDYLFFVFKEATSDCYDVIHEYNLHFGHLKLAMV